MNPRVVELRQKSQDARALAQETRRLSKIAIIESQKVRDLARRVARQVEARQRQR
jgi:hypothetical protein